MTTSDETRRALSRAFRELTLNLIGLFDLYEADPELAEHAAVALGEVYSAHLRPPVQTPWRKSMEALLDEVEAGNTP